MALNFLPFLNDFFKIYIILVTIRFTLMNWFSVWFIIIDFRLEVMVSWIVGLKSADPTRSRLVGSGLESITFLPLHPYSRLTFWNRFVTSRTRPPTTTWSSPPSTRPNSTTSEKYRNMLINNNSRNNNTNNNNNDKNNNNNNSDNNNKNVVIATFSLVT